MQQRMKDEQCVLCDNDDVLEIMSLWVWLLGVVRVWLFIPEIQFRHL